jgi:glutamyl/glutaminyl-tRNA synthetase
LAVVVDDHLMKISHIMRGVEWLPSTPKHILLYKAFGWELPHIGHLPNLKDVSSTKKLSKRDGSVNATEFLKDGYLSQALLNFLMFLGWNPGTEKEIYSLEEFINDFSIEKIHKTDLVSFDRDRLNWINGYYIRQLSPQDFYKSYLTWAERFDTPINLNLRDSTKGTKVLQMIQERVKKYSEVASMIQYFFEEPYVDAYTLSQFAKEANPKDIITNFWLFYKDFKSWEKEELDKLSHEFIRDKGYKPKEAFMTIRVAITGEVATPPLFDVLEFVGKQGVMSRLEKSLKLLN